jgi:hypothetical protein
MDIGSIFLILALLVVVGVFISRPFFDSERSTTREEETTGGLSRQEDHERSALLAERDRLLNALQELDFDYTLGKIPAEDYPQQRTILLQRGADVLRQLDDLHEGVASDDAEERIEAAIAARRADARQTEPQNGREAAPQAVAIASPDDDLEVIIANRRRARQEKAAGFCHKCGGPLQKSDRFCPKCGAPCAAQK